MSLEVHIDWEAQTHLVGRLHPAGLKTVEAKKILGEVFRAVSEWRNTGRRLRLKAPTLDAYASAFEHPLMDEARKILGR